MRRIYQILINVTVDGAFLMPNVEMDGDDSTKIDLS
jgi:hypothetical protein